jgi:hypothetical protein
MTTSPRIYLSLFLLLSILSFDSCQKDDTPSTSDLTLHNTSNQPIVAWNNLLLDIDRIAPGYRPPAAARMMAYTNLAVYESVVQGMEHHQSVKKYFNGLNIPSPEPDQPYHWATTANTVYAEMLIGFFPHIPESYKNQITQLRDSINYNFRNQFGWVISDRSIAYGKAVAQAVLQYSKEDTYGHYAYQNPNPTTYHPPVGDGLWQPTPPDYQLALFPYWSQVRPLALKPDDLSDLTPPLPFSNDPSSTLYQQALEVYQVSKQPMNTEYKWIAEFWSDDIFGLTFEPAARWIAIANQVYTRQNTDLETCVATNAKLGIAMADATLLAWHEKYHYNIERPVSYIRRNIDGTYLTALNNPFSGISGISPYFPSYPSGHSALGGAAAAILSEEFGQSYAMTDRCHELRTEFNGTPRSFSSFSAMAYESSISRIYLGVHYRMDCIEGLRLGALAGKRTNELLWNK